MRGLQFRRSQDGKERATIRLGIRVTRGELERLKEICTMNDDEVRDLLERLIYHYVNFTMWEDETARALKQWRERAGLRGPDEDKACT